MGKSKKKKYHVPARLNILFFAVFILFSALILRLGIVQIVEGEEFTKELERTSNTTARIDAPRGLMYDRFGNVVVDNELELSVTYTNPGGISNKKMLEIARDLEPLLEVETDKLLDRDKQDYILLNMTEEERYELVTREERGDLDNSEQYKLEIKAITQEDLDKLTEKDEKVIAIFREMVRGYANSPQRIKRNITEEEVHIISENLYRLPGIDILRDSRRSYAYGDSFRGFFGSTGSIPKESVDHFLSRGYERSDIVGTSFLEEQYEEVLRGQKAVVESIMTSTGGQTIDSSVNEKLGQRGNDLMLTLDMELQQVTENAINNELSKPGNPFIRDSSAYVVLMDPRTGDILSMAGFLDNAGEEQTSTADHIGNVNKVFEMGSSVKGASVLTGYQEGIISPNSRLNDRVIRLPGGIEKSSFGKNEYGLINDRYALRVSSNVYMFEIGLRMMGCYNSNPMNCSFPTKSTLESYEKVRYNFSQFGLGSETGIDLPSTSSGFIGEPGLPGTLLDLLIGQYDAYTPLQLAQYISTIANDGYRMKPRIVSEVREPVTDPEQIGAVLHKFEPTILNRVDMSDAFINQVQLGLRDVVTGAKGTANKTFGNKPYQLAAKTGTAQTALNGIKGNNQTFVAYAPFDNPEIAIAVVVPKVKLKGNGGRDGMAQNIAEEILDQYFIEMKKARQGPQKVAEPLLENVDEDEEQMEVE
ncbi:peptidoglycan D,D-transpeptidase FtsI family protein [Bacillus suaedae]|uniref:serine-type D-Ala-D-Ala carboxypeptidase n=1 Tax=Halalkalibacter suaedae TaxID=2822140 RepID=A0A941AQI7_9BACI|nr:penicillin-binding protein 2 [Bacillus suaedae]MBP3951253.1 penicillin-binding protein 2 [Bacillus suaedae]